ncbi:dTDP-4-dehydrorhamnose 3,5-epimerase [Gammaproteobacteria bacterium]|nr:dTDP-4-dehydrorhamnose 3,5-epimerase [Gammaproteobacteria bacterium]
MNHVEKKLDGVIVLEPKIFSDDRGYFFESYNKKVFDEIIGNNINFVQDNQSVSTKGVLRGIHYQTDPKAQGKLVRVIQGEIFDVAVDLRKDSKTFGNWISQVISSKNNLQMWIPKGFGHAFFTISDEAIVSYKVDEYYSKDNEKSIRYDDKTLDIQWPPGEVLLSKKDSKGNPFIGNSSLF